MQKGNKQETTKQDMTQASLRLEAQPIELGLMSRSQLKGAEKLASFVRFAYEQSDGSSDANQYHNQVLMVSGDKGSGKTTLLLTLRKWLEDTSELGREIGEISERSGFSAHECEEYKKAETTIPIKHDGKSKITWLDPLSLDYLPKGSNLVASLFARISHEIGRRSDQHRGVLEPVSAEDRAIHELQSLTNDAVTCLEGNLDQRAPYMDPDSYAIAATEGEKKKLEVKSRLNSVLGRLIAGPQRKSDDKVKGIFIFPVDDLDSSPERAMEMLKIAYSLSIPRLLFVLLGSVETMDQILFYKIQGEFRDLLRSQGQINPDDLESVTAKANIVASSLLRKMVPPSHRIQLDPLTVQHARRFKPEKKYTDGLEKKLSSLAFSPEVLFTGSYPPPNISVASLLLAKEPWVKDGSESAKATESTSYFYDGLGLLQVAPRQLADLYSLVERSIPPQTDTSSNTATVQEPNWSTADQKTFLGNLFHEIFCPIVDEDGPLTPPIQRSLKKCLEVDSLFNEVELTPPSIQMVPETGDHIELDIPPRLTEKGSQHEAMISTYVIADRVRTVGLEAAYGDKPRALAPATRSTFKALHDLIRFTNAGVITKPVTHVALNKLALTRWDNGSDTKPEFPWLSVEWKTFWHTDLFLRLWNRGLQKVREICRDPADLKEEELAHLLACIAATSMVATASAWITTDAKVSVPASLENAMTEFFSSQPTPPQESGKPARWTFEGLKFSTLMEEVEKQAKQLCDWVAQKREEGRDDDEAEQIDAVLINLILLKTTECNIPRVAIQTGGPLTSFSDHFRTVFQMREAAAPKAAVINQHIGKLNRRADRQIERRNAGLPQWFSDATKEEIS